ncbi:MAG: 50S ribosomal protein L3 [Planctomycetota bacterium]
MVKGLLGRKVGMTQVYNESGEAVPVTVIEAGPCHVLQLRTRQRDGYEAVQLGYQDKKRPQGNRPRSRQSQSRRSERGHVTSKLNSKRARRRAAAGAEVPAKPECEPKQLVRELRGGTDGHEVGQQLTVGVLSDVPAVDITGISKGRGYAGVMKRHNFSGQRASHGVKKVHRHPGGTGMSATPSRLFKGRRMAGRYGGDRVTTRNLKVYRVDEASNLLLVKGAVPGANGGWVIIRETNKVG